MLNEIINDIPLMHPKFGVTVVSGDSMTATLAVEPLDQGFGHTLGNALRRVMLSSLPGCAITKVKITGADHQFTTLEGLKEDLVDFVLNLKNLRISSASGAPGVLKLDVKGAKEVKGSDVTCEGGFEVVNKDLVLANLSAGAKLKAEMIVETGVGYSLSAERKNLSLGEIPMDALFSPVLSVSYKVETTRVGRRTDFDKILFTIHTDGTIAPAEVLSISARILAKQAMQVFEPVLQQVPEVTTSLSPGEAEVMRLTVEELDLPTRIANALRKGGFKTVGDMIGISKSSVSKVKNLGGKSVDLIDEALQKKGVSLME